MEHFYIVSRGELSVEGEDGVTLGTINEGEALGEISLLAGKRRYSNSSVPRVKCNTSSTTTPTVGGPAPIPARSHTLEQ